MEFVLIMHKKRFENNFNGFLDLLKTKYAFQPIEE